MANSSVLVLRDTQCFCRLFISAKGGAALECAATKCDLEGIRTLDPQLRRLLLYPAELPDLVAFRGAKLLLIFVLCNIAAQINGQKRCSNQNFRLCGCLFSN